MSFDLPYVSIIIPTYNRLHPLSACLACLEKLDYPRNRFEIVVVNDGSTISLDAAITPFKDKLPVTLITKDNAGPAAARNTGAKAAKGDILAFTDDDCQPADDWLKNLILYFRQTPQETDVPITVGGGVLNALPQNPYATASQDLVDYLYTQYNINPHNAGFFTSNNFALLAKDFHQVGGFNETFPLAAGEDREFCDRWRTNGYQLRYLPEAIVHHAHKLTLKSFWEQQFNYGRGAFHFYKHSAQRQTHKGSRQPWMFYLNLLQYPFDQKPILEAIPIALLFLLSQVAVATGLIYESVKSRLQKKINSQ